MKTAISIPDPLFDEAEATARLLGMSRSELYTKAVRRFLEGRRDSAVTEALNRVYARQPSTLDPTLAAIQAASLPEDDW